MQEQSNGTPWNDALWVAERAIVLQVLRKEKDPRWTLAELQAEIDDLDPTALGVAFDRLRVEGLLVDCDDGVVASRAAFHLDDLGMVAI
jgi:hypothetical protein